MVNRGTGKTIPFECKLGNDSTSPTDLHRRDLLVQRDLINLLVSEGWQNGKKMSNACDEAQKKTGSLLSTAFVARDMAQIIDSLNEDGKLRYWGMVQAHLHVKGRELIHFRNFLWHHPWSHIRSHVP